MEEAVLMEECMYGILKEMPNAKHRSKGVGARSEVGNFAKEFQRMSLGLQGICGGIGIPKNLQRFRMYLHLLPFGR